MPNYKGRRPGTRRIVIWSKGKPLEWIVEGSKPDGDAFEARKRLELEAGQKETRSVPTFSAFCEERYRPHAEAHLKASTWRKVRIYQVATLVEFFGQKKLTEITLQDVESFKVSRAVGATAVNNELRVLRTMLNFAEALNIPVPKLRWKKLPVRGAGRVRVWTVTELERLFSAARERAPAMLPVLVFLANTGCRKGEALAAEWTWMDFPRGMIRIPSNEFWQPKNGLPREVPMSDAVRAILSGPRAHPQWVFPNRHGGRFAEFPKDLFWEVRDAAGLTGGVHTLRHTFASHFLQAVPDMFLLAQVLGHSHQRVTELYSHLLPDHLERARNAVNLLPKTMATSMAKAAGASRTPRKTAKRH